MGHRYAGSEPSSDGLVLGSRLQRLALCLPPGGRERGTASVLGFRWHKLERRYTNSTPRYVGLTLGCTLGGGITVFHQGSSNDGTLWYTYSTDGTQWGTDTLVPNLTLTDSPSAVVYNGLLYVFHQGGGERENASVLGFRWHRLERRYSNSERRYVGPTRGSTLGRWYYCPHQGYGDNGSLWYTYSPDGTNWGEDTLVQNVGMTDSPSALVY
jgi:hypothetical protein